MQHKQDGEATTTDFSLTHSRLISFALSAMFTSAFLATAPEGMVTAAAGPNIQTVLMRLQESGLPGTASMPSPASVDVPRSVALNTPAQSASPLSAEQLQKILKDMQDRNQMATLNPQLTDSLGLTKDGKVLTLQFRALKDDKGIYHSFFRLDGNTGYLIAQRTENGVTTCHVDINLNPVKAVIHPSGQPGVYVAPPLAETAKMLHAELLVWADIANQISGANS